MSDPRQAHQEAVGWAKAEIGRVQEHLSAISAMMEESVVGAVYNATGGEECNMESGRMAFQWTSGLTASAEEMFRVTENINAELDRYANGF